MKMKNTKRRARKLAPLKIKKNYEWLKLLFETPRLGIEKEPGVVVDLEAEYRCLRNNYELWRG